MTGDLWLVRHGESAANILATRAERDGLESIAVDERDADVTLSDDGRAQAHALGAWLADTELGAIWTSPYERARQTFALAAAVAEEERLARVDERLRDRELGILDGLTRHGVAARHPEEAERRQRLGKYYHRPPGGESWADVSLRLRSFLHDLPESDAATLIVAHDAVIMLLTAILLDWDEATLLDFAADHTVLNCSVTHLRRGENGWSVVVFSDVAHLERAGAPITVHPGNPDVEPE